MSAIWCVQSIEILFSLVQIAFVKQHPDVMVFLHLLVLNLMVKTHFLSNSRRCKAHHPRGGVDERGDRRRLRFRSLQNRFVDGEFVVQLRRVQRRRRRLHAHFRGGEETGLSRLLANQTLSLKFEDTAKLQEVRS